MDRDQTVAPVGHAQSSSGFVLCHGSHRAAVDYKGSVIEVDDQPWCSPDHPLEEAKSRSYCSGWSIEDDRGCVGSVHGKERQVLRLELMRELTGLASGLMWEVRNDLGLDEWEGWKPSITKL